MTNLVIFTAKHYKGCLNMKKEERKLIERAAKRCNHDKVAMALLLGITTRTLYNKIIQHGLEQQLKIYDKK